MPHAPIRKPSRFTHPIFKNRLFTESVVMNHQKRNNAARCIAVCLLLGWPAIAPGQDNLDRLERLLERERAAEAREDPAARDPSAKPDEPGYLGIVAAEERGVLTIVSVRDGAAAQRAGLRFGDVIRRIGDRDLRSLEDMAAALKPLRAGDRVEIVIRRDDREMALPVVLGKRPIETPEGAADPEGEPPAAAEVKPESAIDALGALEELIDEDAPPPSKEAEALRRRVEELEGELDSLRRRIAELERRLKEARD